MKRPQIYLNISITILFLGLTAVCFLFLSNRKNSTINAQTKTEIQKTISENRVESEETEEDFSPPLNKIWIKSKNYSYEGYRFTKKCVDEAEIYVDDNCRLQISKDKKTLAEFTSSNGIWLEYGFFNFLGKKSKQLVVFKYSGGAHCCDDYVIYDLVPGFRVVYDSEKYDSGSEIGNHLKPVDIDKDGVFEFKRDVMAFDYFYASHADSVFPPVVFGYDKETGVYDLANKRFPDYVIGELKENLEWLKKYRKVENELQRFLKDSYIVRKTFLNLIYAGKENEAWKYFDENYNFEDKEEFRTAIKEKLSKEVVYQTIYKN